MLNVKICGITDPESLGAAAENGAAMVGFVFHHRSPRFLSTDHAAALSLMAPLGLRRVGLFVDPSDDAIGPILDAGVMLDMIQLHGNETPERTAALKARYGLPVIKAVGISDASDVAGVAAYEEAADWLLLDAKAPPGEALKGGRGVAFDWSLLAGFTSSRPWLLAGGLNSGNVGEALGLLQPDGIDISSGVEDSPGHKSPRMIREFMDGVRRARA